MKLSLVFMLFSILPAVSAGRLLIDSDGTLRNEKHEPQFLTGVVMSHQTTAEITRFGKNFAAVTRKNTAGSMRRCPLWSTGKSSVSTPSSP